MDNTEKRRYDEILDNRFNSNSIEFYKLPDIELHSYYKNSNPQLSDPYDYNRMIDLETIILQFLKEDNYDINNKCNDLYLLLIIFYKIVKHFKKLYYNEVELFVTFCEVTNINMKEFFGLLLPKFKHKIIDHLKDYRRSSHIDKMDRHISIKKLF